MSTISNTPSDDHSLDVSSAHDIAIAPPAKSEEPPVTGSSIGTSSGTVDTSIDVSAGLPYLPFPFISYVPPDQLIQNLMGIGAAATGVSQEIAKMGQGGDTAEQIIRASELFMSNLAVSVAGNFADAAQKAAEGSNRNMAIKRQDDIQKEKIRQGVQHSERNQQLVKEVNEASDIGPVVAMGAVAAMAFPAAQVFGASAIGLQTIIPTAMDAALSGLTAIFGTTVMVKGLVASLGSAGKPEGVYNADFVAKMTAETFKLINNPDFESAARNILEYKGDGIELSAADISAKIAIVKLTLLMNALSFGSKAELKYLSAEDFKKIFEGENPFDGNDPRSSLISAILSQLGSLSPAYQERVKEGYLRFLNQNPDFDSLKDPVNTIRNMFHPVVGPIGA